MPQLTPADGWIGPSEPRLHAPPPGKRGLVFRVISLVARRFGRADVPDVITVLHLNPRLFWAWIFFASRLMPGGRLPARVRELIILRTAWNCRSRYEWGQHVDVGLSAGVTDDEIVRVSQGPEAFAGKPEQAVLLACDQMCRQQFIEDDVWARIVAQYSSRKMQIEIMMLIGHYVMIAGFLNSAGLVLEPAIEAKLQAFHSRALGIG
jgi:alkylhydroperoxidase family enzyme